MGFSLAARPSAHRSAQRQSTQALKHVAFAKKILEKDTIPEQQPFFPYLVGYVAFYAGDYLTALNQLSNANQNDPFVQCLIAQSYEKLGQQDKAKDYYRKAASATFHNPAAAYAIPFAKMKLS